METFNCLIVEDEPLAVEVLQDYIAQIPFLTCKGVCRDGIYALEFLQKERVDIMFLDIHLPKIKGLDFLRTLKDPPQVIITTAYRDYAVDGFELNVVDYLLKPISFSRFLMAVNKIKRQQKPEAGRFEELPYLLININKRRIKVLLKDILFVESRREYVYIVTKTESYLTKTVLSELEPQLAQANLIRVHRSFIVALDKITAFTASAIEINEYRIPIGRAYQKNVLGLLKQE